VEEIARPRFAIVKRADAAPKVYRPGNSQAKGLQRFGTLERRLAATNAPPASPKETGSRARKRRR